MNSRFSYTLGPITYPSKTAAMAAIRTMAKQPILSEQDQEVLTALLLQHPRAQEKMHPAISHFSTHKFKNYGSWENDFLVHRTDGTTTDFSYQKAFGIKQSTHLEDAARQAIASTIKAYKQARFNTSNTILDDVTQQPITFKHAHVDHAPPNTFKTILADYVATYGTPAIYDRSLYREFSPLDAQQFRTFHDARATLRIIRDGDKP